MIEAVAKVVAGAGEQGPEEKLEALLAQASPETALWANAEVEKLTLEMIEAAAFYLKLGLELGGEESVAAQEGAEKARSWWGREVGKGMGKEEAEELGQSWSDAFDKAKTDFAARHAKAKTEASFAEKLDAATVRLVKAKAKAELEPEPEAELQAGPEAEASKALTIIEPKTVPANETPIEKAIREMNDKHAVISNLGGKCVIMEWVPSPISEGQKELSYQTFAAFRERYANQYVVVSNSKGRWETAPAAPIWLAHPHRRQYEGLDLVPGGPPILPNGYLNLWKGWGVEPRKGSWRLMQRHIVEVLANGNQGFEDFIKRSTAWKFQNLGLPPEVVLALTWRKGRRERRLGLCPNADLRYSWPTNLQHRSSYRKAQSASTKQALPLPR
jgi:hypothetical protein